MDSGDQRQGLRGFLGRVPGAVVLGAWALLILGSFGVAALMESAADRRATVQSRASLVDEIGLKPQVSLDVAQLRARRLDEAAWAERRMRASALGVVVAWLLAFVFVTVGTWRWVAVRDGWVRVQSWHGGKLSMLYLPFTAAVLLYAFAATDPIDDAVGVAVLFITSALLLLACAAMLVRATWNWFTGRETQRKTIGDGAGPEPPQVPRP